MPFRPRHAVAPVVLVAACWVGARSIGSAPSIGPFLDPAHGVWSLSRGAAMPAAADARIPGLSALVNVVYDDRAVPHIFAPTEADAYRALGYVVARDRLFQMYLQTLAAAGRLTEIAGPRALALDREMRGLGLTAVAQRLAEDERGGPEFTAAAEAYAEGVNAYIEAMPASALPLEFRLTGTRPERWSVVDSYLLLGRMGWTLAYGDAEGDRYAAAGRVGMAAAKALFPDVSPIQEPIQPNGTGAPRFATRPLPPPGAPDPAANILALAREAFLPSGVQQRAADEGEATVFASNNWAVSPKRSASGHALLAGDPHLDLTLPSIWYEAHLVVPGKLDVYGVTIPGAPFIVIGFNRDVAWTMTNTGSDVLDFFTEQVDDTLHPARHMVDGNWLKVTPRIETFRNGSGGAVAIDTTYFTYRGPLKKIAGRWMSMRWTVLEAGTEPAALLGVQHAASVSELHARIGRDYMAPAQNFLAADRGGHIALRSTGRFPIRAGDGAGDTIRDGGTRRNDWRGNVPLDAYPQAFDPAQGFVASANQQPIDPATSPYWWGGSFDPWRALRINQILRADSSVTADDMRAFQTDPGSARADLFVARMLAAGRNVLRRNGAATDSVKLARATALLAEWDRRYTKDNRRAVLFEEAMLDVVARTWDELLSSSGTGARRVATPPSAVLLQLMADSSSAWWDDRRTPERETRDDILAQSLVAALDRVVEKRGDPDSDEWRWDHARFANINHLLRLPALSALSVPVQGGPGTLAPSSGTGTHGPSWRMVVDLGPEIQAWTTYPGGQSGNPLSTRYRDRIDMWSRGELEPARVPRTADELPAGQTMSTLTLTGRR